MHIPCALFFFWKLTRNEKIYICLVIGLKYPRKARRTCFGPRNEGVGHAGPQYSRNWPMVSQNQSQARCLCCSPNDTCRGVLWHLFPTAIQKYIVFLLKMKVGNTSKNHSQIVIPNAGVNSIEGRFWWLVVGFDQLNTWQLKVWKAKEKIKCFPPDNTMGCVHPRLVVF